MVVLWTTEDETFNVAVPRLLRIPPLRWVGVFPRTKDSSFSVPRTLSILPATLPKVPCCRLRELRQRV
jgi:hypothetical protein